MGEELDGKMNVADQYPMCDYSDPALGEVVSLGEACVIWKKSRNALKNACLVGRLESRKTLTGGSWLITTVSLTREYGKPEKDILSCLKS